MPLQTHRADPIKLAEDFDEVSLNDISKTRVLSLNHVISPISEYSDSTVSSSTSSSRSSTNTDDGYVLNVDLNYAANAAAKAVFRSPASSNRSSVASKSDEEDLTATPSTVASEFDDTFQPEFNIASNKLNGYAINSLKSKSSITLLSPHQATAISREEFAREPTNLFSVSNGSAPSLSTPVSPANRPAPRPRSYNPPTTVTSPSLKKQASQASQGLRVSSYSSKLPTSAKVSEENDNLTPLPQRPIYRTASTPRFAPDYRPRVRRSASARSLNTNTNMVLPTTRQGLTAQQRLRLRRQNSTSRLTTEELELQCDSDEGDDDIPGDTLVWNVPLSPALFAKQQAQTVPARPKSKRERTLDSLSSIKEAEPTQYFNTPGLEHLSEDARNLTRAFQELPSAKAMDQAHALQQEQPSAKLPPKRRSNDLMDPVPISKEKEAALSRTRPSWLPPKSPEEEARHLYEYQQMMAKATAVEKKQQAKRKSQQAARLKEQQKVEHEWTANVLPRFERAMQEPRTRELWWKGIPVKYRALIWKARAGNTLGITQSTYNQALNHGKELQAKIQSGADLDETETSFKAMLELLQKDTCSALPELGLYGVNGPMHTQLTEILLAFACYRTDIGYKSGMHELAATLLLNLTPFDSFVALAGMLNHSLCQAIYLRDERTLTSYYTSFLKVLNHKLPTLYDHFKAIHLPPSAYLEPMLTTLYAHHTDADTTARIWDVMFFEGDSLLLRVALGVLIKCEHKLYGSTDDVLKVLGWGAPKLDLGGAEDGGDEFMAVVRGGLKTGMAA